MTILFSLPGTVFGKRQIPSKNVLDGLVWLTPLSTIFSRAIHNSYVGYKTESNKRTKQTHRYRQQNDRYQRGRRVREHEEGKGVQICGDGKTLGFGWWAHNVTYRWCMTASYTWNWYNVINQCYPNTFIFFLICSVNIWVSSIAPNLIRETDQWTDNDISTWWTLSKGVPGAMRGL